jgi:polyphosphate kinase
VDIELIVRGMCALRPGIRGLSDRIRVRSILGRFLEHSRIFYFENGGESEVYVGSADWMNRNLHERVEVLFPLKSPLLRDRVVHEILAAAFCAQDFLIGVAEGTKTPEEIPTVVPRRASRALAGVSLGTRVVSSRVSNGKE